MVRMQRSVLMGIVPSTGSPNQIPFGIVVFVSVVVVYLRKTQRVRDERISHKDVNILVLPFLSGLPKSNGPVSIRKNELYLLLHMKFYRM